MKNPKPADPFDPPDPFDPFALLDPIDPDEPLDPGQPWSVEREKGEAQRGIKIRNYDYD